MLLAVVADVHVGNHSAFSGETVGRMNDRCRKILEVLNEAFSEAHERFVSDFVIAGDVFDTDHPFPDMIGALVTMFMEWKSRGMNIHLMVGNHDQHSSAPGDHALAPFAGIVSVYEKPTLLERNPSVYFLPYGYKLPDTLKADVVIAHHGIADDSTHPIKAAAPWVMHEKKLKEWMSANGVKLYLSGDWHEHQRWGNIVQIGALAPVNWTNRAYVPGKYDPYGSVVFVDNKATRVRIPGPRFVRAHSVEEAEQLYHKAKADDMEPYIDLVGEEGIEIPKHMLSRVRVSPSAVQKENQVAKVAEALRSGATLEEEVRFYIENDQETPSELKEQVIEATIKSIRRAKAQDTG